ncbi:hypothetical protein [Escherichia coli]|uniref:hypothetical protein n=2 Tax=Escherichia coli TaxID=562 RepID=UPI000245E6BD|nr:hypothetical protein [Escherichia coli]EHL6319197.1 hypothetical protein [Escherichia coli]EHN92277.1 hypothetical protein ESNG_03474 [Escherichia coli B093]MBB7313443.1 hypothetical protein [Escherichia coli]MCQ6909734.1 hypothetical protein [Escherichia coli]MDL7165603.1 hypothetical protein [Escherichia coli]
MSPVTPPSDLMREERLLCYFTFVMMICVFLSLCLTLSEKENKLAELIGRIPPFFECILLYAPLLFILWKSADLHEKKYNLWQQYKKEHQCKVSDFRPGQTAWTCNDGSVRWRTSTPDDQRYLWEKFKADHACRLIESRDRDNNGPARDAWICDDGAVYWKNRLPG